MRFEDKLTGSVYTLRALCNDYKRFRAESPENFPPTFTHELYSIIHATINGQNDLRIIDRTPAEITRFAFKLRDRLANQ